MNDWNLEKKSYESMYQGITGRKTKIIDIVNENEVGYTASDGNIHLAYSHEVMEGLSELEKKAYRKGVFCHEMLHQIFSDFKLLEKTLTPLPLSKKRNLSIISNLVEDPAIESFAPQVVGGSLLKALRYSISVNYKWSPEINTHESAASQFINALIQFGDMGLVKGYFTFPEAKETFLKVSPVFMEGIEATIPNVRMEKSKEIVELAKDLLREDELLDLLELLQSLGKSMGNGNSSPIKTPEQNDGPDSSKSKNRKITIQKISKEEYDKLKKETEENNPSSTDGDLTIYVCDDEENKEKMEEKSNSLPISKQEEESSQEVSKEKTNHETQEMNDSNSNNNQTEEMDSSSTSSPTSEDSKNSKESSNKEKSFANQDDKSNFDSLFEETEPKLSEEEYKKIIEREMEQHALSIEDYHQIEKELEKERKKMKATKERETVTVDQFDISSKYFKKSDCVNIVAQNYQYQTNIYDTIKNRLTGITGMTNRLRRIFLNDIDDVKYMTSGKLSIKRLNSGKITPKLFERKKERSNKSDLAILAAIDLSGSMRPKLPQTINCCITLAEVFAALNIPFYLFGFNYGGSRPIHTHYITWEHNNLKDREKLVNLIADGCNFDGYSIRYATELLKKRNETHKLMLVLSDGTPSAGCKTPKNRIADTKLAIKEAKKVSSVLGIALQTKEADILHTMYERDFLQIDNVTDLYSMLSKKITQIIKDWE